MSQPNHTELFAMCLCCWGGTYVGKNPGIYVLTYKLSKKLRK